MFVLPRLHLNRPKSFSHTTAPASIYQPVKTVRKDHSKTAFNVSYQNKVAMETVIEQQRRYHEERERITDALTQEALLKKQTLKENINSDSRSRVLLDRFCDISEKLLTIYEDKDGLRKEEINAISGPNEFAEFYGRLRLIKEYHRKYPNEVAEPMQMEFLKYELNV